MVRLVKGAYWDSEIKQSQERGLDGYPVFTRKASTDVSFIACGQAAARRCRSLLSAIRHPQRPYPGGRARDGGQPARFRVPAPAWHGRGALRACRGTGCQRLSLPHLCARAAAMRICWPIWCAGCWRTAPIPPSSTASSTRSCPSRRSSADPVARVRRLPEKPHPRIPLPVALFGAGAAQFRRHRPDRSDAAAAAGRGDEQGRGGALARSAADRRRGASGRGPSRRSIPPIAGGAWARWPRPGPMRWTRPWRGRCAPSRTGTPAVQRRGRNAWNAPPI